MTGCDVGRLTLAADDLITHPDAARLLTALRAQVPRWLRDQLDAATTTVHDGLHAAATATGARHRALPAADHPAWLRLGMLSALAAWCTGDGTTCMHSPHPHRPRPVVAAAWRPDLIVCCACTHLLDLGGVRDRLCDGCGHVCAGPDHADPIHPLLITAGPLQYLAGVCTGCRYWT